MATEKRFLIKWEIDEYATTPLEALRKAIEAMPVPSNEDTQATVFDIEEIDEKGKVVSKIQIDVLDEGCNPFEDEFEKELDEEELQKTMDKTRNENF